MQCRQSDVPVHSLVLKSSYLIFSSSYNVLGNFHITIPGSWAWSQLACFWTHVRVFGLHFFALVFFVCGCVSSNCNVIAVVIPIFSPLLIKSLCVFSLSLSRFLFILCRHLFANKMQTHSINHNFVDHGNYRNYHCLNWPVWFAQTNNDSNNDDDRKLRTSLVFLNTLFFMSC